MNPQIFTLLAWERRLAEQRPLEPSLQETATRMPRRRRRSEER